MKIFFTLAALLFAAFAFSQVVSGNVGIGTTSPTAKLDVVGKVKITDGTQANGRVLTSDASGVASWSPTPATALYFMSRSQFDNTTDFKGQSNPISTVTALANERFLTTGTVNNLGPTTPFTSAATGLSYTIPVTGIYRVTLYTDQGYTNNRISVRAYRGSSPIIYNTDAAGIAIPLVMINLWDLQAGDIVLPVSVGTTPPSGNQYVETVFTVERVN